MGRKDTTRRSHPHSTFDLARASWIAAAMAEFVAFPFDTLKVWKQVHGIRPWTALTAGRTRPSGVMSGVSVGVARLSASTTLVVTLPEATLRLLGLDAASSAAASGAGHSAGHSAVRAPSAWDTTPTAPPVVATSATAGAAATTGSSVGLGLQREALRAVLTSGVALSVNAALVPLETVKTRLQADGALPQPQRRYRGAWDAARHISANEGIRGLWLGTSPTLLRTATYWTVCAPVYNFSKSMLASGTNTTRNTTTSLPPRAAHDQNDDGDHQYRQYRGLGDLGVQFASGTLSCCTAVLASHPFDVAKTRLQNANTAATAATSSSSSSSSSLVQCLRNIVRSEGAKGLLVGIQPRIVRMAPWQLTFWMVYEQVLGWSGS